MSYEGWGYPLNSRKAHYFRDSRSLCGAWRFFGTLQDDHIPSDDDCRSCTKRRGVEVLDAQAD